jgi:hypothetical protein
MAGRSAFISFLQRFRRSQPADTEIGETVLTPSPGMGIPTPYPNTGSAQEPGERTTAIHEEEVPRAGGKATEMETVVGEGQEPGDRTAAQEEEEEMPTPVTGRFEATKMETVVGEGQVHEGDEEEMLEPLAAPPGTGKTILAEAGMERDEESGLLMQQGRVTLDADWNEQFDIEEVVAEPTEHEGDEEEMLQPLTESSAGSISEQLTANAQFSLEASDFNLADGLDDLDDLDELD